MRDFFKAYKEYIIKHPKKKEYWFSTEAFNAEELFDVYENIEETGVSLTKDDADAIVDFVKVSKDLHKLYQDMYAQLNDCVHHLDLKGIEIAEYIVAALNRNFKVIFDKHKEKLDKAENAGYDLLDLVNFKLLSIDPNIGWLDARACMENATDACGLLLNYLRHFLNDNLTTDGFNPNEFAGRIRYMNEIAQSGVAVKFAYDDILHNNGFVSIDIEGKKTIFDYESHNNLILLRAGDLMISMRRFQVIYQTSSSGTNTDLYQYISNMQIKKVYITNSCITLDLEQGVPMLFKQILQEFQASINAYYDFLNINILLPKFHNATIGEAVSVWGAMQYIAVYINTNENFDVAISKREDFAPVPSKILKEKLIEYVMRLTNISQEKIKAVIGSMEADWKKFNNIWTCMIYPVGDYYLLPFFPLIYSTHYNVIDFFLLNGGISLDERGKIFEEYLYNRLNNEHTSYPIKCLHTGTYGKSNDSEEIDVLIGMKNVVLVADAKCIHYSVEPKNYAEAWERLVEGCEQAIRKAKFVKTHSDAFRELGDYSNKKIIPFVITNYPTFTGFSHNGVYVIDSHSFIAYMQSGYLSMRQASGNTSSILGATRFYNTEDQFSDNFESYLSKNPLKEILKQKIYIEDQLLIPECDSWKVIAKTAQVNNDSQFNISNN